MVVVIGNAVMGLSALVLFWFTLSLGRAPQSSVQSPEVGKPPGV